jgi:hypothetical protein
MFTSEQPTMTAANCPSGDRHFYAIAICRWDNQGDAIAGNRQDEMKAEAVCELRRTYDWEQT